MSDRHSTGRGLQAALAAAAHAALIEERAFEFRVANVNGEMYGSQDSILGVHRFYRTRRDSLPVIYPAASVGETGAAAGALGVMGATVAMTKGYAPGRLAMCEAASDGGLRSGVVVTAAP
jgi:3-oxoacyl-(acyl-carrier-protein) synthase